LRLFDTVGRPAEPDATSSLSQHGELTHRAVAGGDLRSSNGEPILTLQQQQQQQQQQHDNDSEIESSSSPPTMRHSNDDGVPATYRTAPHDKKDDGLRRKRRHAWTELARQTRLLQTFAQLNYVAVQKIIKKANKLAPSKPVDASEVLQNTHFGSALDLNAMIANVF
jgi:hypothetical protein